MFCISGTVITVTVETSKYVQYIDSCTTTHSNYIVSVDVRESNGVYSKISILL